MKIYFHIDRAINYINYVAFYNFGGGYIPLRVFFHH